MSSWVCDMSDYMVVPTEYIPWLRCFIVCHPRSMSKYVTPHKFRRFSFCNIFLCRV